jgi:hypothetical protein
MDEQTEIATATLQMGRVTTATLTFELLQEVDEESDAQDEPS